MASGSRVLVYLKASIDSKTTWFAEDQVLIPLFGLQYPETPRIYVEAQFSTNRLSRRRRGGFVADEKRNLKARPVRFEMSKIGGAVDSIRDIAQGKTVTADMGTYGALRNALGWVAEDGPLGENDVLVIWGHGGAWRGVEYVLTLMGRMPAPTISNPTRSSPMLEPTMSEASRIEDFSPQPHDVGSPAVYQHRVDDNVLQPIELREALKDSLQERKLGVIAFQACLMSSLEVAYDVRESAHWMVGSESFINYTDWNWAAWIGEFIRDPKATPLDLMEGLRRNVKNPAALAMIDLGQIDLLVAALDGFVVVAFQTPGAKDAVYAANDKCARLGGDYSGTLDMFEFLDHLLKPDLQPAFRNAADAVMTALRAVMPVAWHPQPSGLALFFPATRKEAETVFGFNDGLYDNGRNISSSFIRDTRWREFLHWLWS